MAIGYDIFLINGRAIEVSAESYEYEDGTYKFFDEEGEVVGEFQKNNIAGITVIEDDEDD